VIGDDDHGRPTWLTVAMGGAAGFLVGVVLMLVLSPDQDADTRTVTVPPPRAAQPTATTPASRPPPTATTPTTTTPTVRTVPVPDVSGEQLDVARERVEAAGLAVEVTGGGAFGVIEESNWVVASQSPPAGEAIAPGDIVTLTAERPD
jgi:beta-lactam-binding protein with PASTA domain